MRIGTWASVGMVLLAAAGCARLSESRLNPMGWFGGGSSQPTTLMPEGGYPTARDDARLGLAHITSARWEPLYEGRILVVTAVPATQGWWDVALVTEMRMPPGRIQPDQDGVLRLRLVGHPPPQGSAASRRAANPASDSVTAALTLSNEALADIREVIISGAGNAVSLRR